MAEINRSRQTSVAYTKTKSYQRAETSWELIIPYIISDIISIRHVRYHVISDIISYIISYTYCILYSISYTRFPVDVEETPGAHLAPAA